MTETNIETEQQPTPADPYAAPGIDVTETKPMQVVNPVNAPDEDDIFTSDGDGLRQAAEKVTERRGGFDKQEWETRHPTPVEYRAGSPDGPQKPRDETVSAEQAASDLSNFRSADAAAELDAAERAAIAELDAQAGLNEAQADAAKPHPEAQPAIQPTEPAEQQQAAELSKLFEQHPQLLQAVETYRAQSEQQVAQAQNEAVQYAQAAQQQYAAELAANATQAAATVFAAFPELHGLPADQLPGAMAMMQRQNPERANQLMAHIQNVQQISNQAQQVQAQQIQVQQQQHRQAFDYYGTQADNAFDTWAHAQDSPERVHEISGHARELLRSEGLSDAQVNHLWQNDGLFRSVTGQKILYMASKYALSQSGAKSKAIRQVPIVQRPGSPAERSDDQQYALRDLNQKLNTTHSAKDAAALLTARRNARR